MNTFHFDPMTPEQAGQFLRNVCEMTAACSRNWDNVQYILTQFVTDAYKGGFRAGQEAMRERTAEICEDERDDWNVMQMQACDDCAKAIRALPTVEPDADHPPNR